MIQERLFKKAQLLENEHLRPEDPVLYWLNNSKELEQPSMLVGHMPYISILAHQLTQTPFLDFPTAGSMALRRTDHAVWDIVWRSF
jgi:phosphohistidine phosphatase SixA